MAESAFMEILREALELSASDIHVDEGGAVMLRAGGELREAGARVFSAADFAVMLEETRCPAAGLFRTEHELDYGCTVEAGGMNVRLRVNLSYSRGRAAAAMRIVPPAVKRIDELGLPAVLKEISRARSGLFLVTGPSGAGKSTTLAAMLEEINSSAPAHIITIEDPIEYIFEPKRALIHQREAGGDTRGFAEALRRAMRQDPDVIMIGELRDAETAGAAMNAAETGHLVLSTLHTGSAVGSLERMCGFFPQHDRGSVRARLAESLTGVMSQRLARRAGSEGRAVAAELLLATGAVKSCIRDGKSSQIRDAMRSGATLGMRTMEQSLAALCRSGTITREEALGLASSREELVECLRQ